MSTVAEIEAAIEQLPPNDFRQLQAWMADQAGKVGRMWSPEELGEGAQRMVDEPDPVKARVLWEKLMAGFYGDAGA